MPQPDLSFASLPAFLLVTFTSLALVTSARWRWSLFALGLQYVGVFILSAQTWPLEMAAVKLVAGWMAAAVLGMAISESVSLRPGTGPAEERAWPSSRVFRLLAGGLVILAAYSLAPGVSAWLPGIPDYQAQGGIMLIGMGLLHLGLTTQPIRVATGLLTALSGFEIIYAAAETSALLAGLLAAVHLSLALVCTYLLLAASGEEVE
jgi:hypothetical protein